MLVWFSYDPVLNFCFLGQINWRGDIGNIFDNLCIHELNKTALGGDGTIQTKWYQTYHIQNVSFSYFCVTEVIQWLVNYIIFPYFRILYNYYQHFFSPKVWSLLMFSEYLKLEGTSGVTQFNLWFFMNWLWRQKGSRKKLSKLSKHSRNIWHVGAWKQNLEARKAQLSVPHMGEKNPSLNTRQRKRATVTAFCVMREERLDSQPHF